LVGVIESPSPGAEVVSGLSLQVQGWAHAPQGIRRVEIRCGDAAMALAQIGLTRPDVRAALGRSDDEQAGFFGLIDIIGLSPGSHCLSLTIVASDDATLTLSREVEVVLPAVQYARWSRRHVHEASVATELLRRPSQSSDISVVVDVPPEGSPADLWKTLHSIDGQLSPAVDVRIRADAATAVPVALPVASTLCAAFASATGRYVTVLRAGDILRKETLEVAAQQLALHPQLGLLYADHDHSVPSGRRPIFKPAWSPLLFDQRNYIERPWFADREAMLSVCAKLGDVPTADEHKLLRLFCHRVPSVGHVATPLLTASNCRAPRAPRVRAATESITDVTRSARRPSVSIVIPSRLADRTVLASCLDGLMRERAGWPEVDVSVILNNVSDVAEATQFLSSWAVSLFLMEGAFNWSALNNAAASATRGELLLFMNDDVEARAPGWLASMTELAERPGTGAVGAVLRYPDGRIQHAGVYIAHGEPLRCRHLFRFCRGDEPEVARLLPYNREQTAVTGACLMSRRSVFEAMGGFDENLPLVFNDIDYCLRLADRGWATVVAAETDLVHHESLSRGGLSETADGDHFRSRWLGNLPPADPFYNPMLRQDTDDWSLEPEAPVETIVRIRRGRPGFDEMSTDLAWKQWGEQDPYFGVITDPKYRNLNITQEAKDTFFASGKTYVHHVLAVCHKRLTGHPFKPKRVLDFGCGVGRLALAFAEHAGEVVGVDVSEGMLAEARRNADERGIGNLTLVMSDDDLSKVEGSFDLIHSAIVFQHIDVPRGRNFFRLLMQRLAPKGVAALHVTYAKQIYADTWGQAPTDKAAESPEQVRLPKPRGLRSLIPLRQPADSKPSEDVPADANRDPEMQMNSYNLNELLFMVQQLGARQVHLEFSDHGGELGAYLYFRRP